ncbi:MAG: alpha/beta hydrolase-fold protein [Ardenticatenaceae bacterium]|nr:alpha/beta hydrolase-fold protein [Ardenticatenaceae bacterium]
MRRRYEKIYSPAIGREMQLLAFGHYGAPILAFPSGGGQFFDFENNDMIQAIAPLIEAGKIKLYCPESIDHETWLNSHIDPHWRGVRYGAYIDFIMNNLVPAIRADCHDAHARLALTGCSLGALHAANFALKFPDVFHYALCMSGRYDLINIMSWDSGSPEVYFNNPIAFTSMLDGAELDRVKNNTHLALVCGQGAWEGKCLDETHRLANNLMHKGISHERDIWGHDVEHHWYWWRQQIRHHLGKTFQ